MAIFIDRRVLDAPQVRGLLAPLSARYQVELLDNVSNPTELEIRLELKAPIDDFWQAAPRETDPKFLRFASRISVAIQETLRAWLPYLWFSDVERFNEFDTAATLLTYAACRPYTAKNKQSYTFDILDDDTPRAVLYSVKRNIQQTLLPVWQMLQLLHHPCATPFAPRRWERIIAVYERNRRHLNSILVAERDLIEEFVARPQILSDSERVEKSHSQVSRRLRKLFDSKDFRFLEGLLEIEAARAAASALGVDPEFSATISANFPAQMPLNRHEEDSLSPHSLEPSELHRTR